ncbi:MAG: hypothetical protein J2P46_20235 [Zavarzinella sp.]|nr:hypothetical protein [Zavarzinella sp.]
MSDDLTDPADDRPAFRRGVIRPFQCLSEGWQLIKDDYWLFLGITLVGVLIAGAVPFNILLGPMMCGIYYCLLRKARGRSVKFEGLFRGFDHFAQSLIASLLMLIPIFAILLPAYVLLFVGLFATMPKPAPGGPPPSGPGGGFFAVFGAFYLVIFITILLVQVLFFFVFPLITDKKLPGLQAVGTSFRAVMANFGGVVGLVLLIALLGLAGSLACCIGAFFVLPIHYAAYAVAYRHVFELETEEPPPVQDYGDPDERALPPDTSPD